MTRCVALASVNTHSLTKRHNKENHGTSVSEDMKERMPGSRNLDICLFRPPETLGQLFLYLFVVSGDRNSRQMSYF